MTIDKKFQNGTEGNKNILLLKFTAFKTVLSIHYKYCILHWHNYIKLCSVMLGNTYIISDLHLSADKPKSFELFQNFIDFICQDKQCHKLYILGDFFNYWIGDDDLNDFNLKVINQLQKLKPFDIKLYFMHGNRDFLIGRKFSKITGAKILKDPHYIEYHNKDIILSHGDTLCTDDKGYQIFRIFARAKIPQLIYLSLTLNYRRKLAYKLRNKSKNKGQRLTIQVDVTEKGVRRFKSDRTILIHGHTHKMAIHKEGKFVRAVLSDWHDEGSYILITPKNIDLHVWPHCQQKKLIYTLR